MKTSFEGLIALVVEDDWLLREAIVIDLQDMGFTVLEAATGAGALSSIQEATTIDLLVTDIQLADALTGWDVAEALRGSYPGIPVLYASGNSPNHRRRVARSGFLCKPFEISQLRLACHDLLAGRSG